MKPTVKYKGRKFFDCLCMTLYTEETLQGTFTTCFPISSLAYRMQQKKPVAGVVIEKTKQWTKFVITNDWGHTKTVQLHNSLETEIEAAIQSAKVHKLL